MYCSSYHFIKPSRELVPEGGICEGKLFMLPHTPAPPLQTFLFPQPGEGRMKRGAGRRRPEIPLNYRTAPIPGMSPLALQSVDRNALVLITKGVTKRRSGLEEYLWACHTGSLQISLTVPR